MKGGVAIAAFLALAALASLMPGASRSAASAVPANFDIYSIGTNGGAPRRLTSDPARDVSPAVSPDGKTLVFARDRDLWLMSTDGTSQRLLAAAPVEVSYEHPSWSATGRLIAFTAWDYSGCRNAFHCAVPSVAVVGADGTGFREIRPFAMTPRWSPRGERLALAGDVIPYDIQPTSIYTVSVAGYGPRLAHSRSFVETPSWSPNGRHVLYTRRSGSGPVVNAVRTDGTGRRRIHEGERPEWSPDGNWIALSLRGRLFLASSRAPFRTRRLAFANAYSWNLRSTRLALVDWRLSVIRPIGRDFRVLCCKERFSTFSDDSPVWSRRGDRIFVAYAPG